MDFFPNKYVHEVHTCEVAFENQPKTAISLGLPESNANTKCIAHSKQRIPIRVTFTSKLPGIGVPRILETSNLKVPVGFGLAFSRM